MKVVSIITMATLFTFSALVQATNLKMSVYNPGEKSIFPVSSEIISGDHQAILIDAQFQKNDAEELVNRIKKTNKKLTTIYISHSDPDYYFALEVITKAFPNAKVLATAETVKAIKATKDGKLAYWGPILKEQAPTKIIVPEVLQGNTLVVDGEKIKIQGLKSAAPDRTFVWIPKLKAVVGGVLVSDNIHVWTADTQSKASRQHWQQALESIKQLKPKVVIPGHYLEPSAKDITTVTFTQNYLKKLEKVLAKSKNSTEVIDMMQQAYPNLKEPASLELSAKVLKGEMKWPQ